MNILVFSWRDPMHPMAGGAEQVMHEHMKGWIEKGYSVTLFSSYFKGGKRQENLDGVTVIRRGVQLLGVHIFGFFWYLFGKHVKFDLVVDQFHGIPFFTPIYVRVPKLAIVQEVARTVWFHNPLPKPLSYFVGIVGYLSEPFIFFIYKWTPFMTGSQSAKSELIKIGIPSKNITIVPHGVIIKTPQPMPGKEKIKTVMFLGAVTKDKGIDDALKCFEILGSKPGCQFWVVGKASHEYLSILDKFAKKDVMKGKFKYWGFVSQEDKFKLLARAHVLVNPSVLEGWGLVNIEANAMGTPIVSYKSPGLIDSVIEGHTGLFCEANNPKSLANTVERLFSSPKLANSLSKGAIAWSKEFTWEKSRQKSVELIESL